MFDIKGCFRPLAARWARRAAFGLAGEAQLAREQPKLIVVPAALGGRQLKSKHAASVPRATAAHVERWIQELREVKNASRFDAGGDEPVQCPVPTAVGMGRHRSTIEAGKKDRDAERDAG